MNSSLNLDRSKWLSCLGLGVLMGGWLRWQGLWREALNWDELNILAIAKLPLNELFRVLMNRDFHPPGFHLLVKLWITLVGDTDTTIHLLAWVLGMLALIVSIAFVHRIFKDWRLTVLTTLLLMINPFLVKYSELATHYSWHTALVLLSWLLLWNRQWMGYALSVLAAIHAHVLGVWFLPWQAVWLWRQKLDRSVWLRWGLCVGIAVLSWLPFFLPLLEPGHVAHQVDVVTIHQRPWLMTLWTYPLNVLLLGVDRIESVTWPEWSLIVLGGLVWGFVLFSLWRLWRTNQEQAEMLLGLSVGPVVLAGLGAIITGMPILVPRALLFCVPGMIIIIAWGLLHLKIHRYAMMGLVAGILWLQADAIGNYPTPMDHGYRDAMATRQFEAPGDGIIVAPGWARLGFIRYYDPTHFGLSSRERQVSPARENVFHMIQQDDEHYLMVSGEDVWRQPDTQARLRRFMQQHRRVLVVGWEDIFMSLLDCKQSIWVLENSGKFTRYPCMRLTR